MKDKPTFSSLLLFALFSALAPAAFASTTWYVNGVSGSDSNNCTSPTTACRTIGHTISLASSGDSIMVAAATYGENLTISKSLNIIGSNASTTIINGVSINNTVVTISNSAARVNLSQLTIRNGHAQNGGGIYNSGTLTISHCVVSGNFASTSVRYESAAGGGIYNSGTLTINNCVVSDNFASASVMFASAAGGGIYGAGNLTINNSTISGNVASEFFFNPGGGGIVVGGLTTINHSTISGNAGSPGGIDSSRTLTIYNTTISGNSGSGIRSSGTLTINNTTISGNSGGIGGGISAGGPTTINNSTISGNSGHDTHGLPRGGGIYNFRSTVTLQNSIVANNIVGGNCLGTMTSHGYNLSSDGTCNFSNSGDRNNTNPMLGTLGNYGGPTQTIPLLTGSPAIDAGNPSGCTDGSNHLLTTDQRGMPRPDHEDTGGCDMGAFEKQSD
jgi:hypothetical protein